jgi:large subunit ribosomal protein L10
MAKTRVKKEEMLSSLDQKIENMKSAVLVDYKGLKVKDIEELRNILRKQGVSFNVSKNTLTKIALKKSGIEFDEGIFKKPVALAFAMEDEVAPAREISLFAKKNEAIEILGGILERKFIDEAMVKNLALLPTKEQLHGKLVGTIAAPLSGFVNVFAGNLRGLVNVLNAHKEEQAQ